MRTQQYNVGTDTHKLCATSCGGVPLAAKFVLTPERRIVGIVTLEDIARE
jgi:hypothetical protein